MRGYDAGRITSYYGMIRYDKIWYCKLGWYDIGVVATINTNICRVRLLSYHVFIFVCFYVLKISMCNSL